MFDKLMLLKQADFSACKDDTSVAPSVTKMTGILNAMKAEGVRKRTATVLLNITLFCKACQLILKPILPVQTKRRINALCRIFQFEDIITSKGGKVVSVDKWGVKKLAYPINYKNDGDYNVMTFEADGTAVKEKAYFTRPNQAKDKRTLPHISKASLFRLQPV